MTTRPADRGLARNLLWLLALAGIVAATVTLWFEGDELIKPSRETAVVKVFRDSSPAVVNLSAERMEERPGFGPGSFPRPPSFEEFFARHFGEEKPDDNLSLGSGIVVDRRGYILTNEHVVINTAWIQVTLADGRTASGEVWGTDPSSDLAVIKVEVDEPLPYLEMGRSDDLMIGENAILIGNPFKLGHTCTAGIISALHRSLSVDGRVYRDLIQIDAAVNPGNSGGPLLNIRGELVGITTALKKEAEGIGFAIPIDRARSVVEDLIQYRYLPTGWVGVSVEDLRDAAEAFGIPGEDGVFVSRVNEEGPAARELLAGDILTSWNGDPIRGVEDFVGKARSMKPGEEAIFNRVRDGEDEKVEIEALVFPESLAEGWAWQHLGIQVEVREARVRTRNGRVAVRKGVYVKDIYPGTYAGANLAPGDLILKLGREDIGDLDDFRKAVVQARARKHVLLHFQRGTFMPFFITLPVNTGGEGW